MYRGAQALMDPWPEPLGRLLGVKPCSQVLSVGVGQTRYLKLAVLDRLENRKRDKDCSLDHNRELILWRGCHRC